MGSPQVFKRIRAPKWATSKLGAIDLDRSDWWWVDNAPDEDDLALLREHGLLDHLIIVDDGDPGALKRVRGMLEELVPNN